MKAEIQNPPAVQTRSLLDAIRTDQYAGYAYAYPHKTSYRKIQPGIALHRAWAEEMKSQLYLYLHLPFCEMRCGFCNLFTVSQPAEVLVDQTITAIERQSRVVADAVRPEQIVQLAIGGGTPTYLDEPELERVLTMLVRDWPIASASIPFSVEVSPATVTPAKLALLVQHGVRRISMGVQSFVDRDLGQLGRPQNNDQVASAIDAIRNADVDVFNLDLIYGSDQQTESDWLETVNKAISYQPEEIFLYPLYVRHLTGLGRTGRTPAENRRHLYLVARQRLIDAGYQPISMRMFRHHSVEYSTQHCCQEDGMIGLGPGARSYTQKLHYSSDYAVSGNGVRRIIADYSTRTDQDFRHADYGFILDSEEQARRYLIRSLLQIDGLCRASFLNRFGIEVIEMLPQVNELVSHDFAIIDQHCIRLTEEGISHSDVIGPWLYSQSVKARMEAFDLR